jgi:mannitol/fructose-specific phosphotransferase system IIA component (Ntr-type)
MNIASGTCDDGSFPFPVRNVPTSVKTPESVIRFLVEEIAKLGQVAPEHVEEVVALLLKREELGVTAIGRGIAVPHTSAPVLREVVSIVGRLASPIDWNALDELPVRMVLLSVTSATEPDIHRKQLAMFAEFAKSL